MDRAKISLLIGLRGYAGERMFEGHVVMLAGGLIRQVDHLVVRDDAATAAKRSQTVKYGKRTFAAVPSAPRPEDLQHGRHTGSLR